MSCGVGRRRSSDPSLLWLWCRPTAAALIRPLTWEPPYAAGVALKRIRSRFPHHVSLPKDFVVMLRTDSQMKTSKLQCFYPDAPPEPKGVTHSRGTIHPSPGHVLRVFLVLTEPLSTPEEFWFGHDQTISWPLSACVAVRPVCRRLPTLAPFFTTSSQLPAGLLFPSPRKECRQGKLSYSKLFFFSGRKKGLTLRNSPTPGSDCMFFHHKIY